MNPRSLLRLSLLAVLGGGLAAQEPGEPFMAYGRSFLKALDEPTPPSLVDLLDRHFVRVPLGAFELRVASSTLAARDDRATVAAIAGALLTLQEKLAAAIITEKQALKLELERLTTARRSLAGWPAKPIAIEPATGTPPPCTLVIARDRTAFLGLVGWLGLWKDSYRQMFWHPGSITATDLRLPDEGPIEIVALEYAAPQPNDDALQGFAMDTREGTGVLQHVLQHSAEAWCWQRFGEGADVSFVLGLATDLVVDVLGQNNARSGGSGKGSSTAAQGGFIPGAPGQGGAMATQNADSSWRHTLGKDYFARVLRQAQTAGAKAADQGRDKYRHFVLHDRGDRQSHVVSAPFLGRAAADREVVPAAFVDDYLEFHRAYRAAFVHWLRTYAVKTRAASAERFGSLLVRLLERRPNTGLEELCSELYGVPLAAKGAGDESLERRFLVWIAERSR